jgi:hypothetical protein
MARNPPLTPAVQSGLVREMYRVVCQAEFDQIQETGTFAYSGGALGKYFWQALRDAEAWPLRRSDDRIVKATYAAEAIEAFDLIPKLDGTGDAYFADEYQMNESLKSITEV